MKILDNQSASIEVGWVEPTANSDGSPLLDLAYSNAYYSVNGGAQIAGPKTPASALTGGGPVQSTLIVPAPTGVRTTIEVTATATDTSGNESVAVPPLKIEIERVAPQVVSNFTVA